MTENDLARLVAQSRCRAFGIGDAANGPQRAVLAALVCGFDRREATVLCEPSLARNATRPPDVVLVDPVAGVHVVEVKGVRLDQVEAVEPGGALAIRYFGLVHAPKNPVVQARNAMFDVRDAAARAFDGDLTVPFSYWVALPSIRRADWFERWGPDAVAPPQLLFADDLPGLAGRLEGAGRGALAGRGLDRWPAEQVTAVWRAFGDSAVLYAEPAEREPRRAAEATLGERFDEAAEAYRTLSDEQQRLSSQDWSAGPRLVRGVAGSGKTIVLANNLARRLARRLGDGLLFPPDEPAPRLLAVCYNRALAPLLRQKLDRAFRQRTGRPLPDDAVEVRHFNGLLWELSRRGLWRYQKVEGAGDERRARQYLADLDHARAHQPALLDAAAYDAIYVDEGQDFLEDDFRLLRGLCRLGDGGAGEPNLCIFYDDAQNLLGRARPNWKSLGLDLTGRRANAMSRCFRNARPIVEAGFNVLYGRFAGSKVGVPTLRFGDVATLVQKGLVADGGDRFEVRFAVRDGMPPRLTLAPDLRRERELLIGRLRWLVEEQEVRPEDVLVLAHSWQRVDGLAGAVRAAGLRSVAEVRVARDVQDRNLRGRGCLTLSTVASAKGYDAYCVLLASAHDFPVDVTGRASFYVGCTRAIEYLEVFAHEATGLVGEFERALASAGAGAAPDPPEPAGAGPVTVRGSNPR